MVGGDRVLCLDGGGIRGLIILEILEAIEKEAGQPIQELFDWVGGTSTGGIIALAIGTGRSVSYIRDMYSRLKNQVFKGSKPYESEPFETLLKQECGDTSVMTDIKNPKVVVTSVLGDHSPWKLHLFHSYQKQHEAAEADKGFLPIKQPGEQYIWETARSTSAAPSYFHPYKQFLDGGLMSNNPTLDILTEIHNYNTEQNKMYNAKPNPKVVVSLGCGHVDYKENESIPDLRWPDILHPIDSLNVAWDTINFINELVNRASLSHGQPTDRAEAWCEMMGVQFVRYSPLLSEDVPLNCVDEEQIEKMLLATKAYIKYNTASIKQVAQQLKHTGCVLV